MPFLPSSEANVIRQAAGKCHEPSPHSRLNYYCVCVCVFTVKGLSTTEVSQYLSQYEEPGVRLTWPRPPIQHEETTGKIKITTWVCTAEDIVTCIKMVRSTMTTSLEIKLLPSFWCLIYKSCFKSTCLQSQSLDQLSDCRWTSHYTQWKEEQNPKGKIRENVFFFSYKTDLYILFTLKCCTTIRLNWGIKNKFQTLNSQHSI